MSRIVAFYLGQAPDDYGRTIGQIWAFDNGRLEAAHDYIQRLFPSRRPSQFEDAPLLDDATVRAFRDSPELRERLLRSFDVMLRFYGLRRDGPEVLEADDFAERAANWLTPYNHNFLRITRILLCLRELGLAEWAEAFFRRLEAIYRRRPDVIGARTFGFWGGAVQP
jgi:hypothetical protein